MCRPHIWASRNSFPSTQAKHTCKRREWSHTKCFYIRMDSELSFLWWNYKKTNRQAKNSVLFDLNTDPPLNDLFQSTLHLKGVNLNLYCHFSPPSRFGCCWPCELHQQLPGTLPGAPEWRPGGRNWTHCCKAVWLHRTSCRHSSGHPPEGKDAKKEITISEQQL